VLHGLQLTGNSSILHSVEQKSAFFLPKVRQMATTDGSKTGKDAIFFATIMTF